MNRYSTRTNPLDRLPTAQRPTVTTLRRTSTSRNVPAVSMQVIALVLTVMMLAPLLWTFVVSVMPRELLLSPRRPILPFIQFTPTFENWEMVFDQGLVIPGLMNSVLTSGLVTVIAVVLGTLAGYGLAHMRNRANARAVLFGLLIPRFVPPVALALPLLLLARQTNLLDTVWGVVIGQVTLVLPFAVIIMRDYFARFPRSLSESARVDGASPLQVLGHVALPNARPAMAATAMLCFVFSWNDFLFPFVFTRQRESMTIVMSLVMTQGIYSTEIGVIATVGLWAIVLPLVLALVVRRYVFNGLSLGIVDEGDQ